MRYYDCNDEKFYATKEGLTKMKKIKIDIISVIVWFFVLIPVSNYYFPKPTYYWPIILIVHIFISVYMAIHVIY